MMLAPILIHRRVKKPLKKKKKKKIYCASLAQGSLLPLMENNVLSRVLVDRSARYATASAAI